MSGKYFLATFGCQMNVYDSNLIGGMLEKKGMHATGEAGEADVLIVNTCSIRGGAEDRAYARIAAMRHYKRRNPDVRIAVIGCMAQNHGQKIPVELDHVDYVVGPDNYRELEDLIFQERAGKPKVLTEQNAFENYDGIMAKLDSAVTCHITIMRGCNKRCTYCIVPTVRGVERSREASSIVEEVERAVSEGVKEVCLLGQTVNSYRTDGDDFASLLRKLDRVSGLKRIRFTSPHPRHFDSHAIRAMAESEKVCNHVHIPVQSGSNAMLKKMRRQYTRERFLEIVRELRENIPNVGLTTDIITGFVGETEADYLETLSLVEEVGFDSAYMFQYSPREGTPAFMEGETLTAAEKQERHERLVQLQMGISERNLDVMAGRVEEILIEDRSSRDANEWIGKTGCCKKVIVPHAPGLAKGSLVPARILSRSGLILRGETTGSATVATEVSGMMKMAKER
ncbi:MAG: tRNA (N6-isopentenyl adenosine(37)-C2)-methylthiotransferase MiaB [Fibrobacteria bacterium]